MRILLINPPNCGRSIPEERYGITSIKQIFRGEPLALEELAGNLVDHEVRILDLKADPDGLDAALTAFKPQLAGITGVTCEANTVLHLASLIKENCGATVVVGGIHASNDPAFFHRPSIDYIVTGIGKKRFASLVATLESRPEQDFLIPGVIRVRPEGGMRWQRWRDTRDDLVVERPPAYALTGQYRSRYVLEKLGLTMGFVASAYGCPHRCSFCSIEAQTGGSYLAKPIEAVLRDISLLPDIPVIRLVDANTFGDIRRAHDLAQALLDSGLRRGYLADVRSDTVVGHPEVLQLWKEAGLRAVIIGFEEICDARLAAMNKANRAASNNEAIAILHAMGISIVGDFIISPDYEEDDFVRLGRYMEEQRIDLPMITVMTPLPGTPLYRQVHEQIVHHDLDYYTLTNAVLPTRLPEHRFYSLYASLLAQGHQHAAL